jgi:hypothetical protein
MPLEKDRADRLAGRPGREWTLEALEAARRAKAVVTTDGSVLAA